MRRVFLAVALAAAAGTAAAGTPCEERQVTAQAALHSLEMADLTRNALDGIDDEVVLIARA